MSDVEFELLGRELRQDISLDQLLNLEDACVVFEGSKKDADGVRYWTYTVGGFLDGAIVGDKSGGALVGGQAIVVHARDRKEADVIAYDGVQDTIKAENAMREKRLQNHVDNKRSEGIITTAEVRQKH